MTSNPVASKENEKYPKFTVSKQNLPQKLRLRKMKAINKL